MIRANFNAYSSYVTDSLYQWDINRTLIINGLNLDVAPEIHFTNDSMDRAIVRQSTLENGAVIVGIPNSLLQQAHTIRAYAGIYEGDTFKTIEVIDISVIAKEKPTDYIIEDSDEEIYSFNALENAITNAIGEFKSSETVILNRLDEANDNAETALSIAKGRNQAHVFNTTSDLHAWLSNKDNAGLYQVGDNLYIVEIDVPDWWVSEVLTEVDAETGFYYKIAQLETQKVDLTNIENDINSLKECYPIDAGTIENLTYRKWSNGVIELWGRLTATYYNANMLATSISLTGNELKNITKVNLSGCNKEIYNYTYNYLINTDADVLILQCTDNTNSFSSSTTAEISVDIKGTWK